MKKTNNKKEAADLSKGTMGTFPGVFTPSILTILGIILFMRLGYIVGSAGLMYSLIIIGLANVISVLTTFSLAAISTNLKVKVGGPYYIISRTLGPEFGGSIGIVLFLAQSISIGFYCIGFGEAVANLLPGAQQETIQIIAAVAVLFLFIFAWLGADWSTRFQYVVMGLLAAAILSFFIGGFLNSDSSILTQNFSAPIESPDFWTLFAIFFPAVTGFTQGVSMSGDLRDPGRSIPLGTFLAVGISIIIYLGASFILASTLPLNILANDYEAMKKVAAFGFLITAGVIAATLSSAMASFLGAPRILQSLASDRIFPFLAMFSKGHGQTSNPRRGVIFSAVIAFATVGMGKLNLIAPIVSMFFLISYGLLNYATFFEARAASPSFRPLFRWFDYRLSLLGWLACLGAMMAIDLKSGIVAIAVLFAIYQYLRRTSGPARWADSRRSYYLQRVRENLLATAIEPEHPRDWRPYILAFSDDSDRRERLLHFASWIEGGSGLTTAAKILEGEGVRTQKLKKEAEAELRKDISRYNLKAFPLVLAAPNLQIGIQTLIQSFGVGPIHANIVLLNWIDEIPKGILGLGNFRFIGNLRVAFRYGCNIIILDAKEDYWKKLEGLSPSEKIIDVYWNDDSTGKLMLLLAYLMRRNESWEESKIRVMVINNDRGTDGVMEKLDKTLKEIRIQADPQLIENADTGTIIEKSSHSSLVFMPFRLKGKRLTGILDKEPDDLILGLPIVALVLASEDIDLEAEPEEGEAGELAKALDALNEAEKKAKKAQKEAVMAAEEAKEVTENIKNMIPSGDTGTIETASMDSKKAKQKAEQAARRAAKAEVKAEEAARKAEELGAEINKDQEKSE